MSTAHQNLSAVHFKGALPDTSAMRFEVIVSEWNTSITDALLNGATRTLMQYGVAAQNIIVSHVPGSFELSLAALWAAEKKNIDAVITLGCVIKGETPHFDFISQAVANGITQAGLSTRKPIVFGVLTTNTLEQAQERSGGKHGNKGDEAAITAIKMLALRNQAATPLKKVKRKLKIEVSSKKAKQKRK